MAGSSKASTVVIPSWVAISWLGAILVLMLTRTSTQPDSSNPDLGYEQGELFFCRRNGLLPPDSIGP